LSSLGLYRDSGSGGGRFRWIKDEIFLRWSVFGFSGKFPSDFSTFSGFAISGVFSVGWYNIGSGRGSGAGFRGLGGVPGLDLEVLGLVLGLDLRFWAGFYDLFGWFSWSYGWFLRSVWVVFMICLGGFGGYLGGLWWIFRWF